MATKNTATTTRKTSCPITRLQFANHGAAATPVTSVAGQPIGVTPRTFSQQPGATGASVGYYGNGKAQLMIGGVPVMCQVAVTITVIGSKELPVTSIAETVKAAHAAEDAAKVTAEFAASVHNSLSTSRELAVA